MKTEGNILEGVLILAGIIAIAGFLFGLGFGLAFKVTGC